MSQSEPTPPDPGQHPYLPPYPPQAGYWPPPMQPQQPRNGFGITALVVGLISIPFGLIPIFGLGALVGGIIAVVFGLLGFSRARKGIASNKKMAIVGTLGGLLAGVLGITGIVIVGNSLSALSNSVTGLAPTPAAAGPGGASSDTSPTGAFGQQISWPNGVAVTASIPKPYTPSQTAAANGSDVRFVSIVVTVTNHMQTNIEASSVGVNATANGQAADVVFDSAQNVGGAPNATILPGKSVTFTQVFGLTSTKPVDLQVEIQPSFGFGYQPAIFTGTA